MSIIKNTVIAAAISLTAALPALSTETTKNWQDTLRAKLANANHYPSSALNRNIQGTVKIRVKFDQDGSLMGAEIFQSSGYKILDTEALQSAMSLKSLPALPAGEGDLSVIIPVVYQIENRPFEKSVSRVRIFASAQ